MKYLKSIVALLFICSINAIAQSSEVFTSEGNAIKGYDPVAFFSESKPVKGADSLTYDWHGAQWLFATAENRERFKKDPEKYAPQYGGYCAYGIAQGHKSPIDINTWTVTANKLYFNYNAEVKEAWAKDQKKFIIDADDKWSDIKHKQ